MVFHKNLIVVVKYNGSILREVDDIIYLPFGSEYSLLFKNKDSRRCAVSIEIDGKNVLDNKLLIINGNSEQELKGFLKNNNTVNKFKFIKKTKEISDHRGDRIDDGIIKIDYQFENLVNLIITSTPSNQYVYNDNGNTADQMLLNSEGVYTEGVHYDTLDISSDNPSWVTISNDFSSQCISCNASMTGDSADFTKPLENEGITVKGEEETQNFREIYLNLCPEVYTITFQLKGQTGNGKLIKPITTKTKLVCETCGRKNRSKNKCCYNCGTYLL